jgi:CDP-diacylglycerol--serine O-phosphatidyltransferase
MGEVREGGEAGTQPELPLPNLPPRQPHSTGEEGGRRRRRRRRRREDVTAPRGLHLLPHLITTGGLFSGFFAIIQATEGNADWAAFGIFVAGICDGLDGRIARLARSQSRFGMEYDSLADIVSFGVAPAVLAFSAGQLNSLGRAGWVMSFLFMACVALRLARFNVAPSAYRGRFEGLPSPAAAGLVASTQLFASVLRETGVEVHVPEWLIAAGVVTVAVLMVSQIPYRSFKEISWRQSFGMLVVAVLIFALVAQEPTLWLFVIGLLYVLSGPVEWLWRWRSGKTLERLPEAPPGEPQASH